MKSLQQSAIPYLQPLIYVHPFSNNLQLPVYTHRTHEKMNQQRTPVGCKHSWSWDKRTDARGKSQEELYSGRTDWGTGEKKKALI